MAKVTKHVPSLTSAAILFACLLSRDAVANTSCTESGTLTVPAAHDVTVAFPTAPITIDVLSFDSNPTGGPMTVTAVGTTPAGMTSIGAGGLNIVFSPGVGQTSGDFTYEITNEVGASASAFVHLVPSVSVNITSRCDGLSCLFTAVPYPTYGARSFDWSFGDGLVQQGWIPLTVLHQYAPTACNPTCQVNIQANFPQGAFARASTSFSPADTQPAKITWQGTFTSLHPGLQIVTANIDSGGGSNQIWVNWGDATGQQQIPPNAVGSFLSQRADHAYAATGRYVVTLTTKQLVGSGAEKDIQFPQTFDVPDAPPTARLAIRLGPADMTVATLNAGDSTDDVAVDHAEYDTGDGSHQLVTAVGGVLPPITHQYKPGSYLPSVKVWDSMGASSLSDPVTLTIPNNPPVAAFAMNCTPDKRCAFDGSLSTDDLGVTSYEWTVNGSIYPVTGSSLALQFPADGNYPVSLRVYDGQYYSTPAARMAVVNTSIQPAALSYYTIPPCRILDTRSSPPALQNGVPRAVTFANRCNVPSFASAVIVNLSVVNAPYQGYLRSWIGSTMPVASTMNFAAQTLATDNATLLLDSTGASQLAAFMRPGDVANVVVDVMGFYAGPIPAGASIPPAAKGPGLFVPFSSPLVTDQSVVGPYLFYSQYTTTNYSRLANGVPLTIPADVSPHCLPYSWCQAQNKPLALAMSLQLVSPQLTGFVSVTPSSVANAGTTTNLLFNAGRTRFNGFVMGLGNQGTGDLTFLMKGDSSTPADWSLDATGGFFTAPSPDVATQFYPVAPCRLLDTRNPAYGVPRLTAPKGSGNPLADSIRVEGNCGVPVGARAVVLHAVTVAPHVTNQALPYDGLVLGPAPMRWSAGNGFNFLDGEVTGLGSITPLTSDPSANDLSMLFRAGASTLNGDSTDLILDVFGYFAPPPQQ